MYKSLALITSLVMLLFIGCQNAKPAKHNEQQERIISLIPSNTEILYQLGVSNQLVGVSTLDDYPKEIQHIEKFDGMKLDYEEILKAEPTIIFAHESMAKAQEKTLQKFKDKGIKVVIVNNAESLNGLYESIHQIAKTVHKQQEAKTLTRDIKRQIDEIAIKYKDKLHNKKVMIEVSSKPDIYTSGNNTLLNDLIEKLGCKNAFSGIEGYQAVNVEAIVQNNPDVILSTNATSNQEFQREVASRNGFRHISAVQQKQVFAVDANLVSRPGPRVAQGMELIAKAIANEK